MSVIACIPSRYQSSRLPGKPLQIIAGKPMVIHVIERTHAAECFDDVVCLTDDERIYNTVIEHNYRACMTSSTCASGTDRLIDYLKQGHEADVLVNVQGDEVLLKPEHVARLVNSFCADANNQMGTLIYPTQNPAVLAASSNVKVVTDINGQALYFSRAPIPGNQAGELPAQGYIHMGIYIYRKDILLKLGELAPSPLEKIEKLEQLRALQHGITIQTVEVPEHQTCSVDTLNDLAQARALMEETLA